MASSSSIEWTRFMCRFSLNNEVEPVKKKAGRLLEGWTWDVMPGVVSGISIRKG